MVDDATIAKIVALDTGLEQKAVSLIETANERGGRDNISVIVVGVSEAIEKRGLMARLLGK
jgi:serine/threonine protein phosphatase PrpC